MAQNNALQQALSAIGKAGNSLATQVSGKGKDLIQKKKAAAEQALKQFSKLVGKNPVPKNRVGKNAKPIGNMTNGTVLYDDGSIKQGADSQYLQNVRNSVFEQYSFTPEAEKFLSRVPLGYTNQENAYGLFSNYGFLDAPTEGPGGILINPDVKRDENSYMPGEVMAHELMHAIDDNLALGEYGWQEPGTQYQQRGGNSASFFEDLMNNTGNDEDLIDFANRNWPTEKFNRDIESFAQTGAEQGQRSLLGPNAKAFKKVFQPISKDVNKSFAYPVRQNVQDTPMRQHTTQQSKLRTGVPGKQIRNRILDPKQLQSIKLEEEYI